MGLRGEMALEAVRIATLLLTHLTEELELLQPFRFDALADGFRRHWSVAFAHGG